VNVTDAAFRMTEKEGRIVKNANPMSDHTPTREQIDEWKRQIDGMSRERMASLWRFAPPGHPFFRSDLPLYDYFRQRFDALGRMNAAVSKQIGWGDE
jgi:hypothetical protein